MANGNFGGGDGSLENPYLVEDAGDLNAMRENLSANYILTNNIDLNNAEWEPVGTFDIEFSGSFNGNNYTISNINVHQTSFYDDCGLFGVAIGATFKGINIVDGMMTGENYIGAICAYSETTHFENCKVKGISFSGENLTGGICGESTSGVYKGCIVEDITMNCNNVTGGLIGWDYDGVIENCTVSNARINETNIAGGLIGWSNGTSVLKSKTVECTIISTNMCAGFIGWFFNMDWDGGGLGSAKECCSIDCTVIGQKNSGGFAGLIELSSAIDCYSTSDVYCAYYDGGGFVASAYEGTTLKNCYASGVMTYDLEDSSYPFDYGGIIGCSYSSDITVTNCYYDGDILTVSGNGFGEDRTTEQMKKQATFENWDFETVWNILENVTYPTFDKIAQLDAILLNTLKITREGRSHG